MTPAHRRPHWDARPDILVIGHLLMTPLGSLACVITILTTLAACSPLSLGGPGAVSTATPVPTSPVGPPQVVAWQRAAVEEGVVDVYADMAPAETELVGELFAKRHPGVRISWTRGLDRDLVAQVATELGRSGSRAAGDGFDVLVGDAGVALKTAGAAARWSPPEAVALRPGFADAEGAWHALAATHHVLQFYTERHPPAARPTRYEQLTAPHFTGRLALEEEALGWLKGLIEARGRQPTIDLLREIARQGVAVQRGPRILGDLVATGRHQVAISNRLDVVERARRTGAKTGWMPIDPVVVQPTAVVVSARAPHPNAARLFANFLLTADAQELLAAGGRVPTRVDVDPQPREPLRGLRPHLTLPPEGDDERDLRALYADIWRSR